MANILKITNKKPFERMVSLLEKHPDVARGKGHFRLSKQRTNDLWEQFTVELNSIGPPTRSSQEWQIVWIHYKANLKRKLVNNKKNFSATKGGPSEEISLSPLEESVADLIRLHNTLTPPGRAFTNQETIIIETENDFGQLNCQLPNECAQTPSRSPLQPGQPPTLPTRSPHRSPSLPRPSRSLPNPRRRRRNENKNIEEQRLNAILTQTKNHTEILKTFKTLEKTSYKNYLISKETFELKKKKVALLEKQMAQAREFHEAKMEYTKTKI